MSNIIETILSDALAAEKQAEPDTDDSNGVDYDAAKAETQRRIIRSLDRIATNRGETLGCVLGFAHELWVATEDSTLVEDDIDADVLYRLRLAQTKDLPKTKGDATRRRLMNEYRQK